ncbi:hypothetical protein J6590_006647, partial [Homalodisca vitripennis]
MSGSTPQYRVRIYRAERSERATGRSTCDVRIGRHLGPSIPCLASLVSYGTAVYRDATETVYS